MTRHLYYATYSRNMTNAIKYILFPLAWAAAGLAGKPPYQASLYASAACGIAYGAFTTKFAKDEAIVMDDNFREAVSAELGIAPEEVKFSDYGKSQNIIARNEYKDWKRVQKVRYATDTLAFLPIVLHGVLSCIPGAKGHIPDTAAGQPQSQSSWKWALGVLGLNEMVYGAQSLYWVFETDKVRRSGQYETVKVRETLQALRKDIGFNDVFSILQRTRDDLREATGEERYRRYNYAEKEAIRPLVNLIIEKFFKTKFGTSELMYLAGLDKINIHDRQGNISQEAIDRSCQEIEKLAAIGIKGVREENRKQRAAGNISGSMPTRQNSWVDKLLDKTMGSLLPVAVNAGAANGMSVEEKFSQRDPESLTNMR